MEVECIKYSSLNVQIRESHCMDFMGKLHNGLGLNLLLLKVDTVIAPTLQGCWEELLR